MRNNSLFDRSEAGCEHKSLQLAEMAFAIVAAVGSAAGSVLCGLCTVIEKLIAKYDEMEHSNAICKSTLEHLKILLGLLKAINLHAQTHPEVKDAIERISNKFSELENRCFKKVGTNDLMMFIRPKEKELLRIQSDVLQCTTTLNTALLIVAQDDRETEQSRESHNRRFDTMLNPSTQTTLEAIVIDNPTYNENGGVELSWPDNNEQVDKKYEIEISYETETHGKTSLVVCSNRYTAEPFAFLPLVRYTVKVRAKGNNGAILSLWSDSVIVCVPKAPPNKPSCCPELITYICSSTGFSHGDVDSVRLSIPYPTKDDCNGAPLTKIKMYYSNENTMPNFSSLVLENLNPTAQTVDVEVLDFDVENTLKVVWVNECGESAESDTVTLKKISDAIPGTPGQVIEFPKKSNEIIKISWERPKVNAFAVHHYEVYMMDKDDGTFHLNSIHSNTSATIRELKQNTKYLFRVCSVSKNGTKSSFTPEIIIKTNLHKAVQATLGGLGVAGGIAGGIAGGVVSGPVIGIGFGATCGYVAADRVDNKVGKAVVGTLVGIATAIPMSILITLCTPFTMISAPITFATTSVVATKFVMDNNLSEDDKKNNAGLEEQEYDSNDN